MSYPKNPDTIVLKNRYYPKGIREIDLWNYYQKNKVRLLKEVVGRDLFVYLAVDNEPIIQRKGTSTRFIRLNPSNYDQLMTGRTLSVHSTMKRNEDIGIIDIDCDDLRRAKVACLETFEYLMTDIPFLKKATIRFTGKTGFHIFCTLTRKTNIDSVRFLFKKFLSESPLSKKYTIEGKRHPGTPNLDLAPNKFRGGFISLHSLSIIGLRCMEIDHGDVINFTPHRALMRI